MTCLPGEDVGIEDFETFIELGFSQTVFNGLRVGDSFEYRSEVDKRVLVMKVSEITYGNDTKPVLTIAHVLRMYCRK
jgi:hypothetical protein